MAEGAKSWTLIYDRLCVVGNGTRVEVVIAMLPVRL